eukprot:tig00021728_g23304.t1
MQLPAASTFSQPAQWAPAPPRPQVTSWLVDADKKRAIEAWERGSWEWDNDFITSAGRAAGDLVASSGEEADSDLDAAAVGSKLAEPETEPRGPAPAAPHSAPVVGPLFRQPSDPPYRLPGGPQGEALVTSVLSLTEALRGATAGRKLLADQLALALSDARLLNSSLFQTIAGRMAVRRALAALRASHNPGLARGTLAALASALQRAGQAPLSVEEAELLVDSATALLLAGTVEMPRASEDLFALDCELTSRLLGRVLQLANEHAGQVAAQLLGRVLQLANEHAGSEGPLRPKAILFHASALDRFEKKEEAIGFYFEAWSELVKRQMTPSPMEAALIPALADLQYSIGRVKMGFYVTEKSYVLAGDSVEAGVSQFLVLHSQVGACRTALDAEGSIALSTRAVEVARRLGPGHEPLLARILHVHAMDLLVAGRLLAARKIRLEALRLLASLDDPALPDLDWCPLIDFGTIGVASALARTKPAVRARIHAVVIMVTKMADPEERTPMLAHVLVRRAEALRAAGKPRAALPLLEAALASYRSKFPHAFPEDHPRVRRVEAGIAALWAEQPPSPQTWRSLVGLPSFSKRGVHRVVPDPEPDCGGGVGVGAGVGGGR